MVGRRGREGVLSPPRGVGPGPVALVRNLLRLVDRDPDPTGLADRGGDDLGILGKAYGSVADRPTAVVFERLREVPMVQGHHGRDLAGTKPVDERAVEVEPAPVDGTFPGRLDAWPSNREAERVQAKAREQVEIVAQPMVEVA